MLLVGAHCHFFHIADSSSSPADLTSNLILDPMCLLLSSSSARPTFTTCLWLLIQLTSSSSLDLTRRSHKTGAPNTTLYVRQQHYLFPILGPVFCPQPNPATKSEVVEWSRRKSGRQEMRGESKGRYERQLLFSLSSN